MQHPWHVPLQDRIAAWIASTPAGTMSKQASGIPPAPGRALLSGDGRPHAPADESTSGPDTGSEVDDKEGEGEEDYKVKSRAGLLHAALDAMYNGHCLALGPPSLHHTHTFATTCVSSLSLCGWCGKGSCATDRPCWASSCVDALPLCCPACWVQAPLDQAQVLEAARLDDAEAAAGDGISDQDFTRGKRFRKLHRVLTSAAVRLGEPAGHWCTPTCILPAQGKGVTRVS
jgi:hypothetical protein